MYGGGGYGGGYGGQPYGGYGMGPPQMGGMPQMGGGAPRQQQSYDSAQDQDRISRTIHVAGIRGLKGQPGINPGEEISEDDLAAFFGNDGEVTAVRINGPHCWIEFADANALQSALQRDGTESGGHHLRISQSKTPIRTNGYTKGRPSNKASDREQAKGAVGGVGFTPGAPPVAAGPVAGPAYVQQRQQVVQQGVQSGAFGVPPPGRQMEPDEIVSLINQSLNVALQEAKATGAFAFAPGQVPANLQVPKSTEQPLYGKSINPVGLQVPVSQPPAAMVNQLSQAQPGMQPQQQQQQQAAAAYYQYQQQQAQYQQQQATAAVPGAAPQQQAYAAYPAPAAAAAAPAAPQVQQPDPSLPLGAALDFVAPEKPKLDDNVPLGALGGERRGSTVLKMRGLPYSTEKEEIIEFFASVPNIAPVDADNIHIALNEMGRPAGTAFVEFPTPDDLTAALQTKNKDEIGGRYIELFPSSREEATRSAQRAALGGF